MKIHFLFLFGISMSITLKALKRIKSQLENDPEIINRNKQRELFMRNDF